MLTDIAIRKRRSRNPGARFFAATFHTSDSAVSRCASLRSAPHAIARLNVPSDALTGKC